MNKKLIFLLLFLLSFTVRLLLVNDGLYHHDSVEAAIAAEKTVKDLDLQPSVHGRYGYTLINSLFYIIPYYLFNIQSAEAAITFATILFSSLAVAALYLLVNELFNNYTAILSALIFSFNSVYLSVTTYAKSHGMALFFVILSFYLLIRYLKYDRNGILFIISFIFSLTIRGDNIVYLPLFLLLLIFPQWFGYQRKNYLYASLTFIFSLVIFILFPAVHPSEFDISLKIFTILLIFLIETLTIPLMVLLAISLVWSNKKATILYVWFLFSFIPLMFISVLQMRLLLNVIIPLIVLFVFNAQRFRKLALVISIAIITLCFVSVYPVLSYRHEHSSGKELGLFVESQLEDDSYVIISSEAIFIEYYSSKKTIGLTKDDAFVDEVNGLLDKHNVYFYCCENEENKEFISKHFKIKPEFTLSLEYYHTSEIRLNLRECVLYRLGWKQKPI